MHPVEDPSYPTVITVGVVNFASVLRDKSATLAKMQGIARDAARQGCDLVVFPELALNSWDDCADCRATGGSCEWHLGQAESVPGPSSDAMAALAAELGIYVIFGLEERDSDEPTRIYNASAIVGPEGVLGSYRKIHLGIPLETFRFSPGSELPVWQTRLGPIGVLICYDFWSNPELARILALKGARLLVNTTGCKGAPGKRDYVVNTTVVRAQENIVYAATANRVDCHDGDAYIGHSVIAGPAFPGFNKVYAEAGDGEGLVVASLNFAQLARWYDLFPWREWRLGAQSYASKLVAEEFAALASESEAAHMPDAIGPRP
jgi:predicted amidohydrolase